jgi:hypothetical protein
MKEVAQMPVAATEAQRDAGPYHRGRAEEERAAAGLSSCMVRDVHLELAELHEMRADGATPNRVAPASHD